MTITTYDFDILPYIVLPITINSNTTKRYIGEDSNYECITIDVEFLETCKKKGSMEKLYNFWKNDCNFGEKNFFIEIPIFGHESVPCYAKFQKNMSATLKTSYTSKNTLEISSTTNFDEFDSGVLLDSYWWESFSQGGAS